MSTSTKLTLLLLHLLSYLFIINCFIKNININKLNSKFNLLRFNKFIYISNPSTGDYDYNQWSNAFQSQVNEFDYTITPENIEGIIPNKLNGYLYRNMPGRFYRGLDTYGHYLDGDGYVIKLSINDNHISFKSKYVKTKEYVDESNANKILYRSSFNTQRKSTKHYFNNYICINNAFDLNLKNLANTNVLYYNDRLFALFEAGIPYEIDSDTLDTINTFNFKISHLKQGLPSYIDELNSFNSNLHNSLFGSYMTAHPKVDSDTNNLISFIWRAKVDLDEPLVNKPMMEFYEWDHNLNVLSNYGNKIVLNNTLTAPHDISITSDSYVIIENILKGDVTPYILGLITASKCVNIDNNQTMILHVIPRASTNSTIRSIPLTPGFTIHSVNSFINSNNQLELFTSGWCTDTIKNGSLKDGLLGAWEGTAPNFDSIPCTYLYQTIVDLENSTLISHKPVKGLEKTIIEHPHINPNYEGKPCRYIWSSLGSRTGQSSPPLGYLKIDLTTGDQQVWYAPLHTYCEEVVIVPKDDGIDKEDNVWIFSTMYDSVRNQSSVNIFDGLDITNGPVTRIWLRHHLPHSLHGTFVKV